VHRARRDWVDFVAESKSSGCQQNEKS